MSTGTPGEACLSDVNGIRVKIMHKFQQRISKWCSQQNPTSLSCFFLNQQFNLNVLRRIILKDTLALLHMNFNVHLHLNKERQVCYNNRTVSRIFFGNIRYIQMYGVNPFNLMTRAQFGAFNDQDGPWIIFWTHKDGLRFLSFSDIKAFFFVKWHWVIWNKKLLEWTLLESGLQ